MYPFAMTGIDHLINDKNELRYIVERSKTYRYRISWISNFLKDSIGIPFPFILFLRHGAITAIFLFTNLTLSYTLNPSLSPPPLSYFLDPKSPPPYSHPKAPSLPSSLCISRKLGTPASDIQVHQMTSSSTDYTLINPFSFDTHKHTPTPTHTHSHK